MKIESMSEAERAEAINYITDGMSKEEAIEKVCGKAFAAEVEVVDARSSMDDVEFDVKPCTIEECETVEHIEAELAQKLSQSPAEMPTATTPIIHGIKNMGTQLCECGKIKIGMKGASTTSQKGNSFRPPQKLDHFLVTTTAKTADDDFEEDTEIMVILGDSCKAIPVVLLYDEPSLNFMTSLAYYDSAKCQCRGNGEVAIKADGTQVECNPETCKFAKDKKCKPNGILSVVLQDAPRVGGVWKFRTTGWNSIRNLMSSIEFIHGLTGGRLAGLPLMLTLQPKSTIIPGTKTKTTIYMVNLEFRGTMGELIERATTRLNSPEQIARIEAKASEMLAIPESSDECQDVQDEFYPETMKEIAQ
jgi:hypothetical protein